MPETVRKHGWLAMLLIAGLGGYLALFYTTRLPTIEQVTGGEFRRIDYWQLLLLPEILIDAWFGNPPQIAFADRLPVFLMAMLIAGCAAATGRLLLAAVGIARLLTRLESFVFSTAVGLATLSTYTLVVGLLGGLRVPVLLWVPLLLPPAGLGVLWLRQARAPNGPPAPTLAEFRETAAASSTSFDWLDPRWLWLAALPAVAILLGGMLPPVHFDVLEYHLQAPKEFFTNGRVAFLPHNVYANMPLGVSMFALLAMSLTGNWWLGALVGKTIVALTAPLTAAALLAAGRRFYGNTAGTVAAVLYLATPWVAHVAMGGLVESPLAMYSFLAIYAVVLLSTPDAPARGSRVCALAALAGYLAGASAACKYPAVLFVIAPLLAWIAFHRTGPGGPAGADRPAGAAVGAWFRSLSSRLRRHRKPLAAFLIAVMLSGGLWYVKNWIFTGNPTYPLLFSIFGDSTGAWSAAQNTPWDRVHSPHTFSLVVLGGDLFRVTLASEWLGPLLFPLALFAFIARKPQRIDRILGGYCVLFLAAWWLLTHRIDRFWVPAIPIIAVLAGVGATWTNHMAWRRSFLALLALTCLANLLVIVSPAPGNYKRFFLPLETARNDPLRVRPWHRYFNTHPPEGKLLLIGDAAVFDLAAPILYSTCFNETPLRRLVELGSPTEIRRRLAHANVSHILVDWGEIERYRATYGFDPWVQPAVFETLVEKGVLAPLPAIDDQAVHVYRVLRL